MSASLELSRSQILAFRQRVNSLDERLPSRTKSLRVATWAGLQDSMPRAALLSLHARVEGCRSSIWQDSSLVQLWGPRFNVYVVSARDLAIFSLGRLPSDATRLRRAQNTADRLHSMLNGRRMPLSQAGNALGVPHNSLRYAAPTGTLLLHWNGARQPDIWIVPPPDMDPPRARLELVRRYLHIFGPATAESFADWAGIRPAEAKAAFDELRRELTPVRTPIGDALILAADEDEFLANAKPAAPARLLPSGDAYYLAWGAAREILVPNAKRRAELWTTRVWPGALLVNGEITGVWRRASTEISIDTWRRLSPTEKEDVETEALSLPLPDLTAPISIRWSRH